MANRKKFRAYLQVLEKYKLKQIDVYRFKDKEILRVMTRMGKLLVIELPKYREDMSVEEFEKIILNALKKVE